MIKKKTILVDKHQKFQTKHLTPSIFSISTAGRGFRVRLQSPSVAVAVSRRGHESTTDWRQANPTRPAAAHQRKG
jgi:hypothetical protein